MTYQQAAQTALDIQDASNLSGVVASFSEVMTALWTEANRTGRGTDWVNQHPVSKLFAEKVSQLAGSDDLFKAWKECQRLAGEGS